MTAGRTSREVKRLLPDGPTSPKSVFNTIVSKNFASLRLVR